MQFFSGCFFFNDTRVYNDAFPLALLIQIYILLGVAIGLKIKN